MGKKQRNPEKAARKKDTASKEESVKQRRINHMVKVFESQGLDKDTINQMVAQYSAGTAKSDESS